MTVAPDDLAFATIAELGEHLRARAVSARQLTELALDRLDTVGRGLNALVTLTPETALAQADRADAELARGVDRGLLHGIPYGAKDLLAARGYPTTWGAAPFAHQVLADDAAVVERLEAAGAVLVGKLAMVELAGGFGYEQPDAAFTGPGRNAWDPECWAGGSSSGSGAAVAAGCVPMAIGSETWGSIVVPAAYNGVTGFRPTYGLVSRRGAMALSWTMDKIGPLARTAADCETALEAIAGPDLDDSATLGRPRYQPDRRRAGFRFALLASAEQDAQPEVAARFRDAVEVFRTIGTVEPVALPDLPFDAAATTIIAVEAASAFEDFIASDAPTALTAPENRVGLIHVLATPATDYLRALRVRRKAIQAMASMLRLYDALLTPGYARVASRLDEPIREEPGDPAARTIGGAANLCGLPGITLPAGPGRDGLPTAVGLTGRVDGDAAVLAAGIAFQGLTYWHRQRPPARDRA